MTISNGIKTAARKMLENISSYVLISRNANNKSVAVNKESIAVIMLIVNAFTLFALTIKVKTPDSQCFDINLSYRDCEVVSYSILFSVVIYKYYNIE